MYIGLQFVTTPYRDNERENIMLTGEISLDTGSVCYSRCNKNRATKYDARRLNDIDMRDYKHTKRARMHSLEFNWGFVITLECC